MTYPKSDWNVTSLKYAYDQNKWLQSVKAVLKDGKEVTLRTYHYDAYGAVSEIKDYRALSKTGEAVTSPEYTVCSYTYDSFRRPASMSYTDSTQPEMVKEAYTYTYDKNSRLIQETLQNLYPEKEEERQDEVRSYTYNARGQLIQTDVKNQLDPANSYITSYTYDAVGNRLTQEKLIAGQEETTRYTYNSLNQLLTSVTKKENGTATESKTYQYDANGSQISEADSISKKETVNTYDPAGRLASCTIKQNGQTTLQQNNNSSLAFARLGARFGSALLTTFYSESLHIFAERISNGGSHPTFDITVLVQEFRNQKMETLPITSTVREACFIRKMETEKKQV